MTITYVSTDGIGDGSSPENPTSVDLLAESEYAYLSFLPGDYSFEQDFTNVGTKELILISPCWGSVSLNLSQTLRLHNRDHGLSA